MATASDVMIVNDVADLLPVPWSDRMIGIDLLVCVGDEELECEVIDRQHLRVRFRSQS